MARRTSAPVAAAQAPLPLTPKTPPHRTYLSDLMLDRLEVPDYGAPPDKALVTSILTLGVLVPIIVRQLPGEDGRIGYSWSRYAVVDGRRRALAAKVARLTTIPAVLVDDTAWDMPVTATVVANTARSRNPYGEFRAVAAALDRGHDLAAIQSATGLTKAEVDKLLTLRGLLPDALRLWERGRMTASVAYALAKLSHLAQSTALHDAGWSPAITETWTGYLHAAHVRAAKEARRSAAAGRLPGAIFADPAGAEEAAHGEPRWSDRVRRLLEEAAALVPAGYEQVDHILDGLRTALIRAGAEEDTAAVAAATEEGLSDDE